MTCLFCRNGTTVAGTKTVTLERGNTVVVFRSVPAAVCDNCGEGIVDDATATRLLATLEQATARGTELEMVRFAA